MPTLSPFESTRRASFISCQVAMCEPIVAYAATIGGPDLLAASGEWSAPLRSCRDLRTMLPLCRVC